MNLNINGHHLEITSAIKQYVMDKLSRVKRHFDHVIDVSVTLSITKLEHTAEATLRTPGKDIHVEATHTDMYAAIDALVDKLDRQVLRHKSKLTNHSHTPMKHQPVEVD